MAQNAKVAGLADELVQSMLRREPATNRPAYKHAREIASRGLRGHQYARTSQFDVSARLAGLDEKFRIKGRDDLADALHARLTRLDALPTQFKPELLALLLQLADRPLENTRVEALELLRPPSPPPPPTWAEILQQHPYSDDDIWSDIDYAADSSGDEQTPQKRAKSKSWPPTSGEEDDTYDPASCVHPPAATLVPEREAVQFWTAASDEDDAQIDITELQAVRETLFMLAGLRTSLYHTDEQQHNVRVAPRYALSHAIPATIHHLLSQFASIGRHVYRLRQWTKKPSELPLIQTFEAAVRRRLLTYDHALARLQRHYLTPATPISVSLLELHNEMERLSMPILRLAHIVSVIEPQLLVNPFSHLEALFDQITLAQMTLEKDLFLYMSDIFFECLQTYLRPIRRWMEAGELRGDDETFFVFANDSSSDAASLWHDRYVLRRDAHNTLRSPTFLQPAAEKIFTTGKSVVFLKDLGIHNTATEVPGSEPWIDRETVCGATTDMPISPFPELFQAAFETWIRSKYSIASTILRRYVFESGGLMRTLFIFESLYLGKNGAAFEEFANAIFERMDAGRKGWDDRYVLTELARGIFGTFMPISDVEKIVVRSTKVKSQGPSVKGLAGLSTEYAVSDVVGCKNSCTLLTTPQLPWSIQNIIQRSSIPIYQQLFTFLLQIYRVKFFLQRARPARNQRTKQAESQLAYKLQHRLTWFIDTLRSFLTETVIFFTTQDMVTAMEKAENIDEMSRIHNKHVSKLCERATLSRDLKPIHDAILETLDLGVLFAETIISASYEGAAWDKAEKTWKAKKSAVSQHVVKELSDSEASERSESGDGLQVSKKTSQQSPREVLQTIDKDFTRLLPFVIAGLRNVGRVGAEPMWEQLAERLEWQGKKERPL